MTQRVSLDVNHYRSFGEATNCVAVVDQDVFAWTFDRLRLPRVVSLDEYVQKVFRVKLPCGLFIEPS